MKFNNITLAACLGVAFIIGAANMESIAQGAEAGVRQASAADRQLELAIRELLTAGLERRRKDRVEDRMRGSVQLQIGRTAALMPVSIVQGLPARLLLR